jgi:hypothetical protein
MGVISPEEIIKSYVIHSTIYNAIPDNNLETGSTTLYYNDITPLKFSPCKDTPWIRKYVKDRIGRSGYSDNEKRDRSLEMFAKFGVCVDAQEMKIYGGPSHIQRMVTLTIQQCGTPNSTINGMNVWNKFNQKNKKEASKFLEVYNPDTFNVPLEQCVNLHKLDNIHLHYRYLDTK